jgi:hypothetical protein
LSLAHAHAGLAMTLLEAIVALVILSLVGVGCLELTHAAANLESSTVAWNDVVSEAESRLTTAVLSAPQETAWSTDDRAATGVRARPTTGIADQGGAARVHAVVTRSTWRSGLDDIAVTVTQANGVSFTLHRLVPSARKGP